MSDWKKIFKKAASEIDDHVDKLKHEFKSRLNLFNPVYVQVYHSYWSEAGLHIKGRVLEDKNIEEATKDDTLWKNVLNTYRRLESDEVPYASLEVHFQGNSYLVKTDDEGYFDLDIDDVPLPVEGGTFETEVKILEAPIPFDENYVGKGWVYAPPSNADFGVISDIDDTIVVTGATNLLKMARETFLSNALTRVPFKGVSGLYEAFRRGKSGTNNNPVYYVSSSPWNLFDLLADFLKVHNIPSGPLMLRDYGVDEDKFLFGTHDEHKVARIEELLTRYPKRGYILVGDSGQRDAAIYLDIAKRFPKRILAIYIRDAKVEKQEATVKEIIAEARKEGIIMMLVPSSLEAAQHALHSNLIHSSSYSLVENAFAEDQVEDSDVEDILGN